MCTSGAVWHAEQRDVRVRFGFKVGRGTRVEEDMSRRQVMIITEKDVKRKGLWNNMCTKIYK